MAIGDTSFMDPTDGGYDYSLPDFSSPAGIPYVGGIQIGLPGGVSIGAGPMTNQPSVPIYPATAPPIYARGPYTNGPSIGLGISSNMLILIVVGVALYVFLK